VTIKLVLVPGERDGMRVPVKIWTEDLDEGTKQQLHNLGKLPFIHKHVAAMPDAHWGMAGGAAWLR
jgi:RNA-splicing ligase RtcB